MTETTPRIFRVIIPVSNLDQATRFYSRLLGFEGREVGGGRVYFDCGPVILALLESSKPPIAEYVYLAVSDLEAVHERARKLGCLARESVHGRSAAEMIVRPWGERSFYTHDPSGNGLCFVDDKTLFTGR